MSLDLCKMEKKSWQMPHILLWMWLGYGFGKRKDPLKKMRENFQIAIAACGLGAGILITMVVVSISVKTSSPPVIPNLYNTIMFIAFIGCALIAGIFITKSSTDSTGFSDALERFAKEVAKTPESLAEMSKAELYKLAESVIFLKAWNIKRTETEMAKYQEGSHQRNALQNEKEALKVELRGKESFFALQFGLHFGSHDRFFNENPLASNTAPLTPEAAAAFAKAEAELQTTPITSQDSLD